jgi:hypothetical protein
MTAAIGTTMTTLETSVRINAPIETVWAILIDFPAYETWNPYMVKIEGEAQAGANILVHSLPVQGGKVMKAPVDVVSIEGFAMRWEGGLPDRGLFMGDHWFVLEWQSNATILRHLEHFSGSMADAIISEHGATIEGNFVIFNNALKIESERISE